MTIVRTLIVVAALVLTGCATAPPTPSPTSPSSSPVATSDPAPAAPAQVFDGACDALLTDDDASSLLGTALENPGNEPGLSVFEQVMPSQGGMRCSWQGSYPAPGVVIIVAPEGVLTIPSQNGCGTQADSGTQFCAVDATVNGIRMSGAVSQADVGTSDLQAVATSVISLFTQRATAAATVAVPTPPAGAWQSMPTCEQVQASPEVQAAVVADPAFFGGLGSDGGYVYLPAEEQMYFGHINGLVNCTLSYSAGGEDYAFDFSALAGAGWVQPELAAASKASESTVDGFDAVVVRPSGVDGKVFVDVFVDGNWISAYVPSAESAYPVLRELAAALG